MNLPIDRVDPSWRALFERESDLLAEISSSISGEAVTPQREEIFRAFEAPLEQVRVVIFGQDPYPSVGVADGLAFSSLPDKPIPASLRNIFKEYESDLGFPAPRAPDLSKWSEAGVMLLNRTLTTVEGERNAHVAKGWRSFTLKVAEELAANDVVAILWGKSARELAPLFQLRVESAHPSPLSARLGFFGSAPFSLVNQKLIESGRAPIDWRL